jgi:SAM-dependent methyltransferase
LDWRRPLANPLVYETVQYLVGAKRGLKLLLNDYVRPRAGERMLDIGCGPAEVLRFLPAVEYVGIDASEAYISRARHAFGHKAIFRHEHIDRLPLHEYRDFDIVLAIGVLHHIDDAEARRLFEVAAMALRPGGRVVTADPCFFPGQARINRFVVSRDRGRHVRQFQQYGELARVEFRSVSANLMDGRLPFPHSVCVLRCEH